MTPNGWFQIALFFGILLLITKPLGIYMAQIFERKRSFADPIFNPIERLLYRSTGVDETHEMRWPEYSVSMLIFSAATMLLTYGIERIQQYLPWNPQHLAAIAPDLAFNTAASFTTNTNWQSYTPESTMSYFTQMVGLATHNFWSGAIGIALAIAFIRGIAQKERDTLGNFWVDMTRAILRLLLPLCIVYGLVLVSQGVIQNLRPYDTAKMLDPQVVSVTGSNGKLTTQTITDQTIAQGPVASQEAIKMLGTNGGGFFNANSAHPFENPTPFSNLLQMLSIFAIPAGLTVTLGRMTKSPRHGWAVFAAMSILFFAGVTTAYWAESQPNPLLHGVNQHVTAMQAGGNMEGKEVRFGITNSALFATVTTDASCGAVNAMHDSFMPLGGLVPMVNIMLGEVVFGGVGAGMYGMLVMIILTVFIAGLMVGRTPEYLGKKIESYDVKMAMLYVLIFPLTILVLAAVASLSPTYGLSSLNNAGPHGLSEILYAYASAVGNNGSAFAGLNANTHFYNLTLAAAMLIGRFLMIVPMLALAGNLATKKLVPPSSGTFPVTTPLFASLLVSVVLIVSALTFFPALSLGPILEHLLLFAGKTF
ncbi:potassium-transporting ATPase potassium-binding subunit [Edaphobacter acidisoli]|uniref:Potassium-transporting ATPase potassium-binding subunit n=1 Tax=Edaphobacter acidisoli TaxID=2040573 RepID=A0A916RKH2_9BACT|nr:potassium-transporting ATPase subunit KdpA [Edaphobacter acidisoli]GGA59394.1 potassium-transporting ATPase potassium-binding subunit [Edaphobacter acidisoli]